MAPWPWIELISEMAALVPFYKTAGFHKIGPVGEKRRRSESALRRGPRSGGTWGKSGWTKAGFTDYAQRARFSRPTYFLRDNRGYAVDARGA